MEAPQTFQGAAGLDFFEEDKLLRQILEDLLPEEGRDGVFKRLSELGALCGGRLGRLIETAHLDSRRPELIQSDRWGNRVDTIRYCAEEVEARRLAMQSGLLAPVSLIERMTKAYLLNQNGESGITCPLAMTDGLVDLLEAKGTREQKERWLPLLRDPGVDTPLTAGQFVTERQGGSNVSENETRAERRPDGSWRLTGLKWFCSNPGELWVTTAKPEGSDNVALFLMPRRLEDGSLNEAHILRLKDLAGTWGKSTAEVEYRGAYAELIGRASQGMALLLGTVLRTSRIHVAAASLGFMRRAFLEAKLFCRDRVVLGRPVCELPQAAMELEGMERSLGSCTRAVFDMLARIASGDLAAEAVIPLLKIQVSRAGTEMVHRARLLLAGNATLRDFSILPRLAEDAVTQEIWEGTHPILAGHVYRALKRPAPGKAFLDVLDEPRRKALAKELDRLRRAPADERARGLLPLCDQAFEAYIASLPG